MRNLPRSGTRTRERIVDTAEALVYRHGFSATSVDKVIEGAGITKGAFFYHFRTKADLGRSLIRRYAERDLAHLENTIARADRLSDDPRQRVLILVGLLREGLEALPDPVPGCLFTSFLYESAEYPADVAGIAEQTIGKWIDKVADKIAAAAEAGAVTDKVQPASLAKTLLALIEGGFVLAKAQQNATVLTELLDQFRAQLATILGVDAGSQQPRP